MRRAIVHIGAHKTGSTSIQEALNGFDDGQTFYARLEHANHSIPIITAFSETYQSYHIWTRRGLSAEDIGAMRDRFRTLLCAQLSESSADTIIFSGEDISLLRATDAAEFIGVLKRFCREVSVVCYVRDPLSYAASFFQQKVKGGLGELPGLIRPVYRDRLQKFVELVGRENVMVRDFAPGSLRDGDVVADFCALAGVAPPAGNKVIANPGLGRNALKCLYHLNRTNPLIFGDETLVRARSQLVATLGRILHDDRKIDARLLEHCADYSDAPYLEEQFGLAFRPPVEPDRTGDDLAAWLNGSDDDLTQRLLDVLHRSGITGTFGHKLEKVVNRLFYLILEGAAPTRDGLSLVSAKLALSDADVLRDVALKYESGAPVSKSEAIALMQLALRARPAGPVIRKKLEEWTES